MDILLRKQNYIVGRLFPASILVYGIFVKGEYPDLFFEFEDLIEMPAVDRIELDKTDLTLEIGDAIRLYPTLYPSGATGKIVWSSSG